MYSTHNEGETVAAERLIRILKGKIYKKSTANDRKLYFRYLNKLIDEYNSSYHHSIVKKVIDADYSTLTEEIESNPKAPKFKVGNRVKITNYKPTLIIGQEKYFWLILCWKLILHRTELMFWIENRNNKKVSCKEIVAE